MNKITVPKAVADAIKHFRGQGESNPRIYNLANSAYTETGPDAPHVMALRTIEIGALMQALVLDFESQKSLEEELTEFVDTHQWPNNEHTLHAIRDVLEIIARHDEKYLPLSLWAKDGFKTVYHTLPTVEMMEAHFSLYWNAIGDTEISTIEGTFVTLIDDYHQSKPLVWRDAYFTHSKMQEIWYIAVEKGLV